MRNTVIVTMSLEFCARLGERLLDVAERLLELGVEIAGERFAGIIRLPGMPGDEDGPARAFGDDAGENARLTCQVPRTNDFFMVCSFL